MMHQKIYAIRVFNHNIHFSINKVIIKISLPVKKIAKEKQPVCFHPLNRLSQLMKIDFGQNLFQAECHAQQLQSALYYRWHQQMRFSFKIRLTSHIKKQRLSKSTSRLLHINFKKLCNISIIMLFLVLALVINNFYAITKFMLTTFCYIIML